MLTIADFKLGRIAFPTIEEGLKEALGDSLDAVGAGLAAGERKPRPLDLTIPVRASSAESNPYADGDRMRRQVRSLMENPAARLSGLYMRISFDPEMSGWALVGGGMLEYDQGGVTFADYKLSLSDSYVVGKRRTHRPARRIAAYDRRLGTTPRDIERLVYSTSFAGSLAVVKVGLPHGISDVRARNIVSAASVQTLTTADGGSSTLYNGLVSGDVLSYEQAEASQGLGDVIVLDRRGSKSPAEVMTIKEPQATFGWEEVYGSDYPLTEGDIPTMQNGLCRTRYVTQEGVTCIALDQFSGGAWVERSRVVPYAGGSATAPVYVLVKEWTPERAVVFFRSQTATDYVDVYMILQRGWTGPRFEMYTRSRTGGAAAPRLWYFPVDANEMLFAKSDALFESWAGWSTGVSWAENIEPWGVLMPISGGGISHNFTVGAPIEVVPIISSAMFGSNRNSLRFVGSLPSSTATGWLGVDIRLGSTEPVRMFEAETYRNASGTTSEVADGTASASKAVKDTQAAETNNTLLEPTGSTIGLIAGNSYALFARVRVETGGATASFKGKIGAAVGSLKTTTSTSWVWVPLGAITKAAAADKLAFIEWRSAGSGNTFVDRVVAIPAEVAADDGLVDLGSASLYDARGIAELVSR